MRFVHVIICILILSILMPALIIYDCKGSNFENNYSFEMQYGLLGQKLYVSTQPSLYCYYSNMTHLVSTDSDFQDFVTPEAVKPIAEEIHNATMDLPNSDEQFANAVLTMVHQIPYVITGVEYPIETLVNNYGDCIGLSLLAASIMKAGGLDVVLIRYEGISPGHINIGVCLDHTPIYHNLLFTATSFGYNNKSYWTAEATPEMDWKVGDQSSMLADASAIVIPLDDSQRLTPGQASASLGLPPKPSNLSISLSPMPMDIESLTRGIVISGTTEPVFSQTNITLYISQNATLDNYLEISTDKEGKYSVIWNFTSASTFYITACSLGNSTYSGADSETLTIFPGPESFTQFQSPDYNYILQDSNTAYNLLGTDDILSHAIRPLQGVNSFLSIPLDVNITFSYDFIIMQTGHSAGNLSSVAIPLQQTEIFTGNQPVQAFDIPYPSYNVLSEAPSRMSPLPLPEDINQTINNQFCFLLQNNGQSNYSLNMRALNSYEISNFTKDEGNMAIMNISESLYKNKWYSVTESIVGDQINARISDSNGIVIKDITFPSSKNATAILVGNNVDNAVAMKGFGLQPTNKSSEVEITRDNYNPLSLPYTTVCAGIIGSFLVSVLFSLRKHKNHSTQRLGNV